MLDNSDAFHFEVGAKKDYKRQSLWWYFLLLQQKRSSSLACCCCRWEQQRREGSCFATKQCFSCGSSRIALSVGRTKSINLLVSTLNHKVPEHRWGQEPDTYIGNNNKTSPFIIACHMVDITCHLFGVIKLNCTALLRSILRNAARSRNTNVKGSCSSF